MRLTSCVFTSCVFWHTITFLDNLMYGPQEEFLNLENKSHNDNLQKVKYLTRYLRWAL